MPLWGALVSELTFDEDHRFAERRSAKETSLLVFTHCVSPL
jgi:hypothetical protein